MRFKMDFSKLPKCGAKPKKNSLRIHPCKHIALKNGRCYYHQGRKITHGKYVQATMEENKKNREFVKAVRASLMSLADFIT